MFFGEVPTRDAEGAILAHSLLLANGKRLRKGLLLTAELVAEITEAGTEAIVVARPDEEDVLEDAAAALLAKGLANETMRLDEARTGRVNFFAKANGLFRVSASVVNAINQTDPAITLATLEDCTEVNAGRMVATIKIIPYAISRASLQAAAACGNGEAMQIMPFTAKRIALVSTELPTLKQSVIDKTRRNLERRLELSGSAIVSERSVAHAAGPIAAALEEVEPGCDMIILFGASAISDIGDVVPAGIEQAGGTIHRFGMPVDPGNLLLLAELAGKPVLGAPGCARSIAENGFDWVLQRLLADMTMDEIDIQSMGVGGLLMETGSRPHPRKSQPVTAPEVAAVILAAGQSRRMGDTNKMTVAVGGKPMVRHAAEAALDAQIEKTVLVTGYQPEAVEQAVEGLRIEAIHNPDYSDGLSSSLAKGIAALPESAGGALILLGDMPLVSSDMIRQMVEAFRQNRDHIVVATHEGKRGNPVLWPARFFAELKALNGDVGARHLIGANPERVIEVELGPAASTDLDTPEALSVYQKQEQ